MGTAARAAEDYPRTLVEFQQRFTTEDTCRAYLEKVRWPDGFRCPRCGSTGGWQTGRGLWMCRQCGRQASVTAGTIFQDTRKPIRLWLLMMWSITSQKNGASAMGLQRELGFTRYETVWMWLHKLRRAMVRPRRERLRGVVEIDETYLGGLEEGVSGRQTEKKAVIAIAVEEDRKGGMGRIRLQHIPDASMCSLHTFVMDNIEAGSLVHTDGWEGYNGLETFGYKRKITVLRRKTQKAHDLLPRVHRVASLLKRWLLGTHQGAVGHSHLGYYLDEFVFRFNRRTSRQRGNLFFRLVQQALLVEPVAWSEVADGDPRGPQPVGGT